MNKNQWACGCGKVITQHGNRTGHCAKCHETFEGISLFDAHQRINDDGSVRCLDPASLKFRGHVPTLEDGSWRGPKMPESVAARYRGEAA